MFEIIGNKVAKEKIELYLKSSCVQPLIFYGQEGLGKLIAATYIAATTLNCTPEELKYNPGYHLIDHDGTIKVDEIEHLLKASKIKSNAKVFVINHADRISIQSMNKLLKLLEDECITNKVIFICSKKLLLPTIESRCWLIPFKPLEEEQMKEFLLGQEISNWEWFSFISDQSPYRFLKNKELYTTLYALFEKMLDSSTQDLFSLFHMVKEKDENSSFEEFKSNREEFLGIFIYLFLKVVKMKLKIIDTDTKYIVWNERYSLPVAFQMLEQSVAYKAKGKEFSKNDFFDLLCLLQK